MIIAKILDGVGLYGSLLHLVIAATFFGTAALIFFYLWRKGLLDMDQSPADKMLENDADDNIKKDEDHE